MFELLSEPLHITPSVLSQQLHLPMEFKQGKCKTNVILTDSET
jgi:hypothetical protein